MSSVPPGTLSKTKRAYSVPPPAVGGSTSTGLVAGTLARLANGNKRPVFREFCIKFRMEYIHVTVHVNLRASQMGAKATVVHNLYTCSCMCVTITQEYVAVHHACVCVY